MFPVQHLERLRAEIKAAIKRGDMNEAWFWVGVIVCLPPELKQNVSQPRQ